MRRSKDELVKLFSEVIGENDSDAALTFMEDLSDSLEDNDRDEVEWKARYEENDKAWRQRYKERFTNPPEKGDPVLEPDEDVGPEPEEEDMKIDDLFTTKKEG